VTRDNRGKQTAGIDGVKGLTPPQRGTLAQALRLDGHATPLRRTWIPQRGSPDKRPLGIPAYADDCAVLHEDRRVLKHCQQLLRAWLVEIWLTLNEAKSRISHTFPWDGSSSDIGSGSAPIGPLPRRPHVLTPSISTPIVRWPLPGM